MDTRSYVEDCTLCLSTLAIDASLLANFIVSNEERAALLSAPIASYPFFRSCFDVCVGIRDNVDVGVLQAFDSFKAETGYEPRTDLYDIYVLNRRPRDYLIKGEMMTAAKRHIEFIGTTKVLDFLTFRVSQVFWAWNDRAGFANDAAFIARRIREHLVIDISLKEKALPALSKLLLKWGVDISQQEALYSAVYTICDELQPFIQAIKYAAACAIKDPKPPAYLYKAGLSQGRYQVMRMAVYMGDLLNHVRDVRHANSKAVMDVQQPVRKSRYFEGITKWHAGYKSMFDSLGIHEQKNFECLQAWLTSPSQLSGKMSAEQANAVMVLHQKVSDRRRQLFKLQTDLPGNTMVEKTFTLLPVCSASRSFITIDHDSLRVWVRHHATMTRETAKPLEARNWWSAHFDPYKTEVVSRGSSKTSTSKSKRFRYVRSKSKKKVHVRHLTKYRDIMLDQNAYDEALSDPTQPVPFFLSNIRTDGIQVKLLLRTLADHHPTARHVDLLVKKGYSSIAMTTDRKLDIFKETRGVFDESRVKPMTKSQVKLVEANPHDVSVTIRPCDPGNIKMVQWGNASLLEDPHTFASNGQRHRYIHSTTYRVMSLSKNASKFEEHRRHSNDAYISAISELSGERLDHNYQNLRSYIKTRNSVKEALTEELMSTERTRLRWVRHRAQQRACRHLARQIVGRCTLAAEVKSISRLKEKAATHPKQAEQVRKRMDLRETLKQRLGRLRVNVVMFGKASFGHGGGGPCPRKRLIKKMAETAIVILIDEFRTSKMCCGGCGHEAKQLKGSRVLRCQSGNPGEDVANSATSSSSECSFSTETPFEMDRDQAAVVNMFRIGCGILKGTGRPHHLRRKAEDVSELNDDEEC